MLKTTLRGALVAGVAIAASFGVTSAAAAAPDAEAAGAPAVTDVAPQVAGLEGMLDLPDTNIGNDLCLLPWFWPGPFNVLTEGQTGSYSACNGSSGSSTGEGINILNNACVAPWLWQGPFNVLTSGLESEYEACNTVSAETGFANALAQYTTIKYMIDSEMLDATAFEPFLSGEASTHDVILDESILGEFGATSVEADGTGIGNNACILPWLWQGPLNFLTIGQTAEYEACNG